MNRQRFQLQNKKQQVSPAFQSLLLNDRLFYVDLWKYDIKQACNIELQLVMWSKSTPLLLSLFLTLVLGSYLEFQLLRMPHKSLSFKFEPISCKNESSINQDAEYKEICYQKDISYVIPFIKDGQHYGMAADFTAPISWIKGPDCKIDGTQHKCKRLIQTVVDKVKEIKKKVMNKIHKKSSDSQIQNAIIEGSSETIRGEFEQCKNISFVSKDSSRLNNFFQLMLLGLFIYGEKDTLALDSTNFINAISISSNLNGLSDGAISMRFDQTSENSFLNQIFSYVKSAKKSVCVYLGENNTLTIGDETAKYTESGFSSIKWMDMPDDEGFGKLAQISDIDVEDIQDDNEEDNDQTVPAVVTLSASYIGLPQDIINSLVKSFKNATCKTDSKTYYLSCESSNKKNFDKIIKKHLVFGFGESKIMLPIEILVLKQESKKIILNIKKTFNNRVILGEPIFKKYTVLFDYTNNKIGFAQKREVFKSFFINTVSMVRFLCFVFVIGCSFILCYQPIRKMIVALKERGLGKNDGQGRRLKQYSPIQDNPYEDLKGKIQQVISSTDKEVEGI